MKILGKIQSNAGHKKLDYLSTITKKEIEVLKMILLNNNRKFKNGSPEKNALIGMRRFLNKFKN